MTAKLAGSAPFPDTAVHLGRQLGIGQQQLDQRGNYLLSGDAGESEAVGGFSLPDVQGPVGGGGQVDGPSRSLATGWLVEFLPDAGLPDVGEAFGGRRGVRAPM